MVLYDATNSVVAALAITTAAAAILLPSLCRLIIVVWWRPLCIRRAFLNQGIPCLPYRLLVGNLRELAAMNEVAKSAPFPQGSNNIAPRILPHFFEWRKQFGEHFIFWLGYNAVLPVSDPEDIHEILSNKFSQFPKCVLAPDIQDLARGTVAFLEGKKWAERRHIIKPAFFMENLKLMVPTMVACISTMLERWQSQLDGGTKSAHSIEIDVHEEYKSLTADIIAQTTFGSSYEEGKQISKLQHEQLVIAANTGCSIYIPGLSFLPTAHNRYRWRLKKEINAIVHHIIQCQVEDTSMNNLLGILMTAHRKGLSGKENIQLSMEEIVGECKAFFFAGHETTSDFLTWTTMLLAIHQEWQERTREETFHICGKQSPDAESLNSLKLVGMVLNEALRLYPPATVLLRKSATETKLRTISIPPNTLLLMPVLALHHDPKFWGQDVLEFNPERFANGIANACNPPSAFLPFSTGSRNCVGKNFSLLEAKLILTMMLQRFQFSLSSEYKHSPITLLTLQPQHGMQIIVEKVR